MDDCSNCDHSSEDGVFVGLWVDDLRPIPPELLDAGWCCARSFHEAITKLELMDFESISLDHDLASFYGEREMTGYDITLWLAQRRQDGLFVPPTIWVHSANPVGHERILGVIKRYLSSDSPMR